MPLSPDMHATISALSSILKDYVKQVDEFQDRELSPTMQVFAEDALLSRKENIMKLRPDLLLHLRKHPTAHSFKVFLMNVCEEFRLSESILLCAWIYVHRFMWALRDKLYATTWRPVLFCAILLAHKMFDDNARRNTAFANIYPALNARELAQLEMTFFTTIKFQTLVSPLVYLGYQEQLEAIKVVYLPTEESPSSVTRVLQTSSAPVSPLPPVSLTRNRSMPVNLKMSGDRHIERFDILSSKTSSKDHAVSTHKRGLLQAASTRAVQTFARLHSKEMRRSRSREELPPLSNAKLRH
eukprot:GILJ01003262.1.p1 GENE.GILJ01003262.1~~GILJ01003262.1.p1  ORF type:complete len:316 (+),score=36.00 GILJ01003262.1:60-950(+)